MKLVAVLKGIACINHIIVEFFPKFDKKLAITPLLIIVLIDMIKRGTLTISVEIPLIPKQRMASEKNAIQIQM